MKNQKSLSRHEKFKTKIKIKKSVKTKVSNHMSKPKVQSTEIQKKRKKVNSLLNIVSSQQVIDIFANRGAHYI